MAILLGSVTKDEEHVPSVLPSESGRFSDQLGPRVQISGKALSRLTQRRHELARLLWHAPPYRIRAGTVRDTPGDIRRQPCAHSHFEQFSVTRSHGSDCLANGRGHHAGRPKIFEVSKCSLHSELAHFDRIEVGG